MITHGYALNKSGDARIRQPVMGNETEMLHYLLRDVMDVALCNKYLEQGPLWQ